MKWVLVSFANGFIDNANEGLQLYISGESGLGKSESIKSVLRLLPQPYVVNGQFTKKGLIYCAKAWPEGTIVLKDDHVIDEDEAGLYRAMTAGWKDQTKYYSVKNQESMEITVPRRITEITTSADGLASATSGGQNESRYLTLEITRSQSDMEKILEFIKNQENKTGNDADIDTETILAIWRVIIHEDRHDIRIPFIKRIHADQKSVRKIREFKKFLSVIRAIALLRGRSAATENDFHEACMMWTYILTMEDNEIPGLRRTERVVFDKLVEIAPLGTTTYLHSLCEALPGMHQSNIYRAICGRNGTFTNPTDGLLTKVKGLRIVDVFNKDTGVHAKEIRCLGKGFSCTAPYTLDNDKSPILDKAENVG